MKSARTWNEYTLEEMLFECTDEYELKLGLIVNKNGTVVMLESVLNDMKSYYGYEVIVHTYGRFLVHEKDLIK